MKKNTMNAEYMMNYMMMNYMMMNYMMMNYMAMEGGMSAEMKKMYTQMMDQNYDMFQKAEGMMQEMKAHSMRKAM